MKIEKRQFDATDDQVIVEIYRIITVLSRAGIIPYISKIKSELKCSEADIVNFLLNYQNLFEIVHDKGKTAVKATGNLEAKMNLIAAKANQ